MPVMGILGYESRIPLMSDCNCALLTSGVVIASWCPVSLLACDKLRLWPRGKVFFIHIFLPSAIVR